VLEIDRDPSSSALARRTSRTFSLACAARA